MKGFTLVETILVLAMLVIISGLSIPFIQSFNASSDLYTYSDQIEKFVRKAHDQARSGLNGSAWGVYFNSSAHQIILYRGDRYVTRDSDYDLALNYPAPYSVSTDFGTDLNFKAYAGTPDNVGIITVLGPTAAAKNFTVDDLGLIK
ncbi:MAG: type II secretion system protein [Patescibacteria group bacterium]|nr:type II secretion system protein [Patescibacteria group bacterium]